jgi:hypothetical protein
VTTSKGIIAIVAIIAAITTGSFLTGAGAASNAKPRAKADKIEAILAAHEKRIVALETLLGVQPPGDDDGGSGGTTTTSTAPPTTTAGGSTTTTTTTTVAASTTTTNATTTTAAPAPSGACAYPSGDPPGAQQIGDQRLTANQVLENFVLHSGGNHAILPPNVSNVTVRNGSVYANNADNIKLGINSRYENLYLVMAPSGAHLDAMQGQGASGVTMNNITIVMQNHSGVTSAILFQSLLGGGGDQHTDVTFDLNCIKLVGSGPYGHDIRVDYKSGADVTGRITNVSMSGSILITDRGGGGNCRIEVDASALPHVVSNGCDIVSI